LCFEIIDQLLKRIARHRPAPRDRLSGFHQMPDRQHRDAEAGGHGFELAVLRGWLGAFGGHQAGLRRAVDIGIDQPDLVAAARKRDGEVGR
jgi:hypothetical protein